MKKCRLFDTQVQNGRHFLVLSIQQTIDNMQTNYTVFSTKDNHYLYSPNRTCIFLIHPLMFHLLKLNKKGRLQTWLRSIKNASFIFIEDIGEVSREEIFYQYKKILFLSRNNFFHKEATQNLYQLTGEDVKYSLANTISLTFEVTENCNLDCEYCIFGKYYLNKREEYKPIKLTSETAIKILNRVIPLWNSSLNSSFDKKLSIGFYGGEPLLNVCFIEKVVEYLKQSSLIDMNFIEFTMTTNGILLDKYISFLVENNFFIKISLDGGKETDNSYRKFKNGQSAYKNIYNNILLIKNEYPDYFEKNVDFISVLHDRNDHFEISKFFHTQFNKRANISELATDFLNPDTEIEFRKMYRSSSDVFTDRNNTHKSVSFDETLKFIRFHTGYFKTTYTDLLVKQNAPGYIPGGTCTPFSRKIFITNDGKILPCERISHQYEFGYVNEYEINLDFDMIAKEYNRYFSILYNQCRECIYKQQCGECMFQLNIGSNNFKCKNFRKKSERNIEKFLSENITIIEQIPSLYLQTTKIKLT